MSKQNENYICYQYKDGRFLKTVYMGDGDYEIHLVTKVEKDCLFDKKSDWSLKQIIADCDSVYDENEDWLDIELKEEDFTITNASLTKK